MTKWAYKIIDSRDVEREGFFKGRERSKLEEYLNKLGEEGWEVINLDFSDLSDDAGRFYGVAKKPL